MHILDLTMHVQDGCKYLMDDPHSEVKGYFITSDQQMASWTCFVHEGIASLTKLQ